MLADPVAEQIRPPKLSVHGEELEEIFDQLNPDKERLTYRVENYALNQLDSTKSKSQEHDESRLNYECLPREEEDVVLKSNSKIQKTESIENLKKSSMYQMSRSSYSQWLEKKNNEKRIEKKKKTELEKIKELQKIEKIENSKKLFERWKSDIDAKTREQRTKSDAKQKQIQQRKREDDAEKRLAAEKNFELWKRSVNKERRRKSQKDMENAKRKADDQAKKEHEAKLTYDTWLKSKKNWRPSSAKSVTDNEKLLQTKEKELKDFIAQSAYQEWLDYKNEQRSSTAEYVLIEPPLVPWIPPSKLFVHRRPRTTTSERPTSRSNSAFTALRKAPKLKNTDTSWNSQPISKAKL